MKIARPIYGRGTGKPIFLLEGDLSIDPNKKDRLPADSSSLRIGHASDTLKLDMPLEGAERRHIPVKLPLTGLLLDGSAQVPDRVVVP
jgi:hypothetical protein